LRAYQVHGLSKRKPRATALPIHDRNHQLSEQGPSESEADSDKYRQRQANPKSETRFRLISRGINGTMSARPAIKITAMKTSTTNSENRKKLFPSPRNSFHGATIAARLRTIRSTKMNRPRARSHANRTMSRRTTQIRTQIPAMRTGCGIWPIASLNFCAPSRRLSG